MGFKRGEGGRKQGARNKASLVGKSFIENYFYNDKGLERLLNSIESIDCDKTKINALIKLLTFILPKPTEVEVPDAEKFLIVNLNGSKLNPFTSEDQVKE